jgi:hypothetical protein
MIYQLARTSPLISGQVKMSMIMHGDTVVDLQYTPISNNITFNYNNPVDVLNYTHGENVKMLYNKISDVFYSEVTNPLLSLKTLHRYDTLIDDTHDNTYEMGMKRIEYQRYKKQFEFFCPFWCTDEKDLNNIKFIINLQNKEGRTMYSKKINFSEKISSYLKNIYPSIKTSETLNLNEMLFINFNDMQSYIKGINIDKGTMQTVDTSYIVNNLLYCERPVLETDNMLANLFATHKIICPQLFNFNFIFDLEDFIPINLLNDFRLERINAFVDIYIEDKKCDLKDFYTNYEFIPKYDIYEGKYLKKDIENNDKNNVLNYLKDYKSISLINKNKLSQGTFHWVLLNNKKSIFNLYNGFSPLYNGEPFCNAISNDSADLMTDEFNLYKNPFGVFKYTNCTKMTKIELAKEINKDDNYSSFNLNLNSNKEFEFFENTLISMTKLEKNDSFKTLKNTKVDINLNDITQIKCGVFLYNTNLSKQSIESLLKNDFDNICGMLNYNTKDNIINTSYITKNSSNNNFICYKKISDNKLKVFFMIKDGAYDEQLKQTLNFASLFNTDFNESIVNKLGSTDTSIIKKFGNVYVVLNLVASILKCAQLPRDIMFDHSFYGEHASSPNIKSQEIELFKSDKFTELYRYDSNIIPMFIDLNDENFFNNTYWCKQYDKSIFNQITKNTRDLDNILTYSKFALDKYSPVYKSIGYYVLNDMPINYDAFYMDEKNYEYIKEKTWYKSNSMIYLPSNIDFEFVYNDTDEVSVEDIIYILFKDYLRNVEEFEGDNIFDYYIKNLYNYSFSYDYVDNKNIHNLKIKVHFELK